MFLGPFTVIVIISYIFLVAPFCYCCWSARKAGVKYINKSLKCVHFVIETHSSHDQDDDDDDGDDDGDDDDVVALGFVC